MNADPPLARLRFDRYELDEADARLTCDGKALALAPKPFAVLCALARSPGRLMTKDALLDLVWGHRFVTESALKSAISELRAALEDDPRQPRYIETVSRRGYRFIAVAIDAPSQSAPAAERNIAAAQDYCTLAALTALCRGNAALADLIRAVATTLQREPLVAQLERHAHVPGHHELGFHRVAHLADAHSGHSLARRSAPAGHANHHKLGDDQISLPHRRERQRALCASAGPWPWAAWRRSRASRRSQGLSRRPVHDVDVIQAHLAAQIKPGAVT